MPDDPTVIPDAREHRLREMANFWAVHAVARGRVPLLPVCSDAEESFLRQQCRYAIRREVERRRRECQPDDLIARHPTLRDPDAPPAPASPRHQHLQRPGEEWAEQVARQGGDVPLPEVEPGEAAMLRDFCATACRRAANRDRQRQRDARRSRSAAREDQQ